MWSAPIAVLAAAVAVTVATACGGVEERKSSDKLTAGELEQFLSEADPDGPTYECEPAVGGRWDYTCTFTDDAGARGKIDLIVNGEQATRSSGVYDADAALGADVPRAPDPKKEKWLANVDRLCGWVKRETAQVAKPATLQEFKVYVRALRDINERYRRKLAALPAAPNPEDRATFETLLVLLKVDRQLATELLEAIRARDQSRMAQLFESLQVQAAEANRMFARMGACPA